MATLLHSESRRMYSWWWDSHISPKNSKWLQENITDMDAKVKVMIKLIEEDADSFARRAEMYYKKRPELMKLVEEFYRAYRALAERYNHAMGELHHAHRTITKAFPDHMPLELVEDSPSKSWTPDRALHTPEMKFPIRTLFKGDDEALGLSGSDSHKVTPQRDDSEEGSRNWSLMQFQDLFGGDKETVLKSVEGRVKKGLKQEREKEESIHDKLAQLTSENQNLKDKILQETEKAGNAEIEIQGLKEALSDTQAEKENVLQQYQQCLAKLQNLEGELNNAQRDSMRLSENSSRAEIEVQTLKEALVQLEAEKNAREAKHKEYLEKISDLEAMLSRVQEDNDGVNMRATKAEIEAQFLKDEISRLKREKDAVLHEYNQCLQKLSVLQNVISAMETEAELLKSQVERAENEVSELKKSLADLNKEKDASALQYQCCLETISKLEKELSSARKDAKRLSNEVLLGNLKLKNAEEKSNILEMSNQSLRAEADNLARKIAVKDKELSEKQEELENLQTSLQDEHLRHTQVEETLETLQSVHSQSQDDQRSLVQELQKVLQMLKDMEVTKHDLEEEIQQVRDENQSLSQMNQCSVVSVENKSNEILTLREIKERLEKEVSHHNNLSNSLQQEILSLKAEIEGLNKSYQAILDQIEAAGLKPECLGTSVKILQVENLKLREMYEQGSSEKEALSKKLENVQDENSKLREMCEQGSSEKEVLSKKLGNIDDENSKLREMCDQGSSEKEVLSKKLENMQEILEKKIVAERSMSDLNNELESSQEKMKVLQESSQLLHGEKAALSMEKACLLSQLQAMAENMHMLLEKNAVLENSLSAAKVELEGLREKTKGLDGICEFLKNERSYLLSERGTLALKLENVERRLDNLENKYIGLEEKYADIVKEKEAVHYQVKELEVSLSAEKKERTDSQLHSQTRLAGLENQIHFLKEENRWKKKEYEEELDKSLKAQFEMSILQKIMKDMEEKNASLIAECKKHVEASKLAEKLISELEGESLEQQVEAEILLDEIERLRLNIYQVFKALGSGADCYSENKIENEESFLHHILGRIDDMKSSISKHEDDQQLLVVENAVLLTLLEQLEAKGLEIESQNKYLNKEFKRMVEKLSVAKNGKDRLLELNRKFESDVNASHQHTAILEAELESLRLKQADLQKSYKSLEDEYLQVNQENANLMKKFSDLKEEKHQMNQLTDAALLENLATANQSEVFRSFGQEKLTELYLLFVDLSRQQEVNSCLKREVMSLTEKLELQKAENLLLQDTVCGLEREMQGIKEYKVQMKKDIASSMENLLQTEGKLFVAEVKLEAAENLNLKLCKTVDELKTEIQEARRIRENQEQGILQLSEKNSIQMKEIKSLLAVQTDLESEIGLLREEIEEKIIREQTLCAELQNKSNEFELWGAEATAFYFSLQINTVHEVFFENKVQELTGLCWTLQNENTSKKSEIDQMKGKICLMESEIDRLKSQLYAYAPVVTALRDDIAFLEHNAFLQTKLKATHNQEPEISEVAATPNRDTPNINLQDQSLVSLQNLQMRIKAVGKSMQEMNKPTHQRRANSISKQEPTVGELERLKPLLCLGRDKHEHSRRKGCGNETTDTPKLQKIKTKSSEARNATLMKDIPLDQVSDGSQNGAPRRSNVRADDKMLELWQTAPDGNRDLTIGESLRRSFKMTDKDIVYDQFNSVKHKSDPPSTDSDVEKELGVDKLEVLTRSTSRNREVNARRILERLSSDAQKLENLQITVQDLRMKLETNKKGRRPKNVDFETVEEQLLEAEETVTYLVDLNGQLVKTVEECPSPDEKTSIQLKEAAKKRRRKVTEQARKGSERIGRLQLELQKIQYMLLKLEDEKKNRVRNKFFRNKTIILRDFIYNGRKNSGKRKKGPFCGCFRPSSSRNGHSSQ